MDGVRLNQPFGDVVSWALVPRIALRHVTMMPGSNPRPFPAVDGEFPGRHTTFLAPGAPLRAWAGVELHF